MISYLNDISCATFGAELLSREIFPCSVTTFDDWIDGAMSPIELKETSLSYSKINLKYFVSGKNETETLLNISNLVQAHIKTVISFKDIDFKFNAKLDAQATPSKITPTNYEVDIELKSDFKIGEDRTLSVLSPMYFNIDCRGNVNTPAIITVTVASDTSGASVKLNDTTFYLGNVTAGDVIVIDGVNYTISKNGKTNFTAVELWSFPELVPGVNSFKLSYSTLTATVSFVERYM